MPEILKIDPAKPDRDLIFRIVQILQQGGVIAYPTETFYGLGTDSKNEKALDRIFAIKGRDFHKPISLIVGDEEGLGHLWEEIPVSARRLMQRFWPGPLTIVFKASSSVPHRLTAETGKIGIRISSHPVAAALAKGLGRALTATSANLSGAPECITAEEVLRQIGDGIDALVDGGSTPGGKGSTILDITVNPPAILREGMVNVSLIGDVLRMTSE